MHKCQSNIIRLLRSGTPVELLEEDADSGYSRVRLNDGTEGWIITRYLQALPSGRDRLAKEESRSSALAEQLRATQEQLAQTRSELDQTGSALQQVTAERDGLQTALDDLRRETADTIAVARRNRELQKQVVELRRGMAELTEENARLGDTSAREWFLLGAALMLVGILFGILVTRIRWNRRRRWEDF